MQGDGDGAQLQGVWMGSRNGMEVKLSWGKKKRVWGYASGESTNT